MARKKKEQTPQPPASPADGAPIDGVAVDELSDDQLRELLVQNLGRVAEGDRVLLADPQATREELESLLSDVLADGAPVDGVSVDELDDGQLRELLAQMNVDVPDEATREELERLLSSLAGPPPEEPDPPKLEAQVVSIKVPLAPPCGGYASSRIDCHLTGPQREVLKRLRAALDEHHARLGTGRHVHTQADAVRWLLEQIAEQAG